MDASDEGERMPVSDDGGTADSGEQALPVEEVDKSVAAACGLCLLCDADLREAASQTGTSPWEVEAAIKRAGLAEQFDLNESSPVTETIDDLLERQADETK